MNTRMDTRIDIRMDTRMGVRMQVNTWEWEKDDERNIRNSIEEIWTLHLLGDNQLFGFEFFNGCNDTMDSTEWNQKKEKMIH